MLIVCPRCEACTEFRNGAVAEMRCKSCKHELSPPKAAGTAARPAPAAGAPAATPVKPAVVERMAPVRPGHDEAEREIAALIAEHQPDNPRVRPKTLPPMREPRGRRIRRAVGRLLPGRKSLAIAASIAALVSVVTFRDGIVRAQPSLAGLYASVGLNINLRGLTFSEMTTEHAEVDGMPVLVVKGTIRNVTRRAVPVPGVKLVIMNSDGRPVYGWLATPSKNRLQAGETLAFRSRLASPPPGERVTLRFARREDYMLAPGQKSAVQAPVAATQDQVPAVATVAVGKPG